MKSWVISSYDQPHQFEPLLPHKYMAELTKLSSAVIEESRLLQLSLSPETCKTIRERTTLMNAYYSNHIEGLAPDPLDIEKALRSEFSADPKTGFQQLLAIAHIKAECELQSRIQSEGLKASAILQTDFLLEAHRALYTQLAPEDRTTEDGRIIQPGVLRTEDVSVGDHLPPSHQSIPSFLSRMDQMYTSSRQWDELLVAIAAAHQRAVWVHPFGDGNGRACRLQTESALLGLNGGLWSVTRGLAQDKQRYFALLSNADMPRQGDLDGRGNLSEKALYQWCVYFIETCSDQVQRVTD